MSFSASSADLHRSMGEATGPWIFAGDPAQLRKFNVFVKMR